MCEARRAEPVVTHLLSRVKELLVEWPDHPGLLQVYMLHGQRSSGILCVLQ